MSNEPKYTYLCHFMFGNGVFTVPSTKGVEAFANGFWIDQQYNLVDEENAEIWMPPHSIVCIEKKELL